MQHQHCYKMMYNESCRTVPSHLGTVQYMHAYVINYVHGLTLQVLSIIQTLTIVKVLKLYS